MWVMIPSLLNIVERLAPAFTLPSFHSCCRLLLGWIMCLGKPTLFRVAHSSKPQDIPDHAKRHGLDTVYNFFERSAWTPAGLGYRLLLLLLSALHLQGRLTVLIDDTLNHKRGKSVWGLGWFRDAVASTKKRVATASGHNWVVLALAVCWPGSGVPILAFPLLARLHVAGKGQPSCAALAKAMLQEVFSWLPGYSFSVVGDGAYACQELLKGDWDARGVFVGRMRGDATLSDPRLPARRPGQPGRPATKGPRLPKPKDLARQADRDGTWRRLGVTLYGQERQLAVVSMVALWPTVLGLRPVRVVVVRDLDGQMKDAYLFTTDVQAAEQWVIVQFSWRWSIEVLFRASKQVLEVEAPQHWCQESVEKVAPWVWGQQSVIMVWYLTAGKETEEAQEIRKRMGEWDSEWSLRHMIQVLRQVILNVTFNPDCANETQLREMVRALKNWANLAA
jgi:hypothetical protein